MTAEPCVYPPYCQQWCAERGRTRHDDASVTADDGRSSMKDRGGGVEESRWKAVHADRGIAMVPGVLRRHRATADGNGRRFVHRRTAADRLSGGSGGHLWEEALENGVSDRGMCPSRGTSAKARMPTRGCRARVGGMCVYWGKLSTTQLIHFTNPTLPLSSILSFPPLRPSRMTRPTRRLKFA